MCSTVLKKDKFRTAITAKEKVLTHHKLSRSRNGICRILKNIRFELIVYRFMSVLEGYIRGVEIKGHFCEKKLVKLVIICQKSINCIFSFSIMWLKKTCTGNGILNKETTSSLCSAGNI